MREELLTLIEKNSRIDIKELAVMLGYSEQEVLDEFGQTHKRMAMCDFF